MKTRLAVVLMLVPLSCGRAERHATSESDAAPPESALASPAPPNELVGEGSRVAPAQPRQRLIQAGYQATRLELPDGTVLDAGHARLVVNTSVKPVRSHLEIQAGDAQRSISGKIVLDFGEFLLGKASVPRAVPGHSILFVTGPQGERDTIQLGRMELTRLATPGRRAQLLIQAFAVDDSPVVTLRAQVDVTCLTDAADLDKNTEGVAAEDSAPLKIVTTDVTLRSDVCRPFASLL